MPPKITIVTAVYNRATTIASALESLEAQHYSNWQHLVIDGGSSDGTLAILNSQPSAQRKIISEPDEGIYFALNKGMYQADGDIIGLLHSDDFFASPNVLEQVANAFEDPQVDAVYGDLEYVSARNPFKRIRYWRAGKFQSRLLQHGWMPPHPTLFLRRRVAEVVGFYDTSFRIAADYDYILRCFSRPGFMVQYIPQVLVRMRVGGASNRSVSHFIQKSWEDFQVIRKNRIGGMVTLLQKNLSKLKQFFISDR
jgi:glycosyltransferase involved in cell wall biosynthesis